MASPDEVKQIFASVCANYVFQLQKTRAEDLDLNLANWQRVFAAIDPALLQQAADAHITKSPHRGIFPNSGDITFQLDNLAHRQHQLAAPAQGAEPERDIEEWRQYWLGRFAWRDQHPNPPDGLTIRDLLYERCPVCHVRHATDCARCTGQRLAYIEYLAAHAQPEPEQMS